MRNPKIYIGPMSKNIVDCCIEFNNGENKVGLIPSRRQIEKGGGYVNGWDTKSFSNYCSDILIKRDHAGPNQGKVEDDGFDSLKEDCKYVDYIHIDPWKKYPIYKDGLEETIKMINYCYGLNNEVRYEVGTEESIRPFSVDEVFQLIMDLKISLPAKIFEKVDYLVIQSGTSLKGNQNTGDYSRERLSQMIEVCRSYDILSKEHNGDYIDPAIIKEKMSLGLDSINIAPEFGLVETQTYLDHGIDIDEFWQICFKSGKWKKWVDSNFDPHAQKIDLIKICGHYVFSDPSFISIKPDVDEQIKDNIFSKLKKLYEQT